MTRKLQYKSRPSRSGQAKSLVVLLHGYGADGADLLGLADPLAPHLPDTAFVAPDAPESCAASPFGYQWFPIPWLDGSSEEEAQEGMLHAADDIGAFLDEQLEEHGISDDKCAIIGFSQGTMMALYVAPRRPRPLAGMVGFSGRLLAPERLASETVSKPPILLIHGDQDDVVPPASLPEAADALTAAGFEVYTHISRGAGHAIAPDGLSVALAFLKDRLGG